MEAQFFFFESLKPHFICLFENAGPLLRNRPFFGLQLGLIAAAILYFGGKTQAHKNNTVGESVWRVQI
jgi:hypothetical protein